MYAVQCWHLDIVIGRHYLRKLYAGDIFNSYRSNSDVALHGLSRWNVVKLRLNSVLSVCSRNMVDQLLIRLHQL